jgi:hypothetical protein
MGKGDNSMSVLMEMTMYVMVAFCEQMLYRGQLLTRVARSVRMAQLNG